MSKLFKTAKEIEEEKKKKQQGITDQQSTDSKPAKRNLLMTSAEIEEYEKNKKKQSAAPAVDLTASSTNMNLPKETRDLFAQTEAYNAKKEQQKKAQEKPRSWVEEAPWTLPSLRTHLACLPLCSLRGGPPGVWAVE